MATATCSQCGKIDFMPGKECKTCGKAYDDATQARIKIDETRESQKAAEAMPAYKPAPGRTCLKCGNANAAANFQPMERCPACGAIYSKVEATAISKAQKYSPAKAEPPSTFGTLVTIAACVLTLNLCSRLTDDNTNSSPNYSSSHASQAPAPAPAPTVTACSSDDAKCLGDREIERARTPCKRAIEASIGTGVRWTHGLLEEPFNQASWYIPIREIIYTGNQLEAGAAGYQRSYYCVWNPTTHTLVKAAAND